jgi:hypothetical protein
MRHSWIMYLLFYVVGSLFPFSKLLGMFKTA